MQAIAIGMPAGVAVTRFPGRTFLGKVAHTANPPDPDSRALPVRIEIQNRDGKLVPGAFARFDSKSFDFKIIAGSTVNGARCEIDDPRKQGAKRILQTVQLGRDYGPQKEEKQTRVNGR